jgi:hypothetical protein
MYFGHKYCIGDWVKHKELQVIGKIVRFIKNNFVQIEAAPTQMYLCHLDDIERKDKYESKRNVLSQ